MVNTKHFCDEHCSRFTTTLWNYPHYINGKTKAHKEVKTFARNHKELVLRRVGIQPRHPLQSPRPHHHAYLPNHRCSCAPAEASPKGGSCDGRESWYRGATGQRWAPLSGEEPRWSQRCGCHRQAGAWHCQTVNYHSTQHREGTLKQK